MNFDNARVRHGLTPRGHLFLFALLLVSTVGVIRLAQLFAPVMLAYVPELLGAVFVAELSAALLWFTKSRSSSSTDASGRSSAEEIIAQITDGMLTVNHYGRIVSLNPAAEQLFGYRTFEVLNAPITTLLAEPTHESRNLFHDTMPIGSILGLAAGAREMTGKRKNGETFPLELTVNSMTLGEDQVTVAFARDVSKRKQAQRYLTAHYAATCLLADARSLEEAIPRLLQAISDALHWEACAYWRFDPDSDTLRCAKVYQAPFAAKALVLDTASLTCELEQGLPGRVWLTGQPLWVEDILQSENCPCLTLAVPLQLHGAFAFPIMMGESVCGVLTLFSSRRLKRDPWLLDIMGDLGKQLGQFIARKRDEEMLHHSEERFRQLAENIHEVFRMVDVREDRIIYVSPSCKDVWGRLCLSFQTNPQAFLEFVHPEDRDRVLASLEKQRQGECTSEEYRIVRPDESIRWVWDRAFPILDDAGQVYRVAGITADITDRRQTEEALRKTTHTLQALIQAAPVAIKIIDLAGRIQLWNPAAERLLGWTEAEVLDSPLSSLEYAGLDESCEGLSAVLQGQTYQVAPTRCRRKDGRTLDVSLSAAPLRNSNGHVIGAVGILMDLTEQKRLEERLGQAQKMEAVGQLAGGIAHDFNNLLTVIMGYCEILLGNSMPDHQTHELLEQIRHAGEKAASLTRQLLAFGRKQTLQPKVLDINTVVNDMGKILRRLIGEDIEMVIQQDPQLGQVKADLVQIEQILLNLAANARDAMPQGGTLTITTTNVEFDQPQLSPHSEIMPGAYVLLAVTDTGCGMNAATKAHAFEPFFTTKELGKGTGLGLATVYGIVKQSNGHIDLESEVGRGSTFRVYLPRLVAVTEAVGSDQKTSPGIFRGKETVLIVEDEDAVRQLVSRALQPSGYTVLSARSGEEALALCQEHKGEIDLLITDVIMPHMNGVQLAELASALRENLQVLYISGYTSNILENRGAFTTSAAFLPKPVTPRVLVKKVREVLDARPCKTAC